MPAPGLEADSADEWLYTVLNNDFQLRALAPGLTWPGGAAPQGTAFPFVTFQFMSGVDYASVGANRIWTNMIYLVKAVGETADYSSLRLIVAQIDALLHRASGQAFLNNGTVWACVREQMIRLPEIVSGKQYRHSGGLYRLYVS